MYDPELVQPMRDEMTRAGFTELRTAADVDAFMQQASGTTLLVVNSVCGCAAGAARPGVRLALDGAARPDHLVTVFAGQDKEATDRARSYFSDYPPSSPSLALFRDGKLVQFIPRHRIEGRDAASFAGELRSLIGQHCGGNGNA
jgi:putative YphP/YqiW family bacilliredoxin